MHIHKHVHMHMYTVTAESKLVAQLACLRCAKNECREFVLEDSYQQTIVAAMHHSDDQVC